MRISGTVLSPGEPEWEYVEVLDIDDYDAYLSAIQNPSGEVGELSAAVFSYVSDKKFIDVYGRSSNSSLCRFTSTI
jgi:hypothetical protein